MICQVCHTRHRAEIVRMAEGTSGMLELPMKVADVDEMAVLDGKLAIRSVESTRATIARGSSRKHTYTMKYDSEHDVVETHGVPLEGSEKRVQATA